MGIILCNYNCKYQNDGYCYLQDTSAPKNAKNDICIYFQKDADVDNTNFLDESEPL